MFALYRSRELDDAGNSTFSRDLYFGPVDDFGSGPVRGSRNAQRFPTAREAYEIGAIHRLSNWRVCAI